MANTYYVTSFGGDCSSAIGFTEYYGADSDGNAANSAADVAALYSDAAFTPPKLNNGTNTTIGWNTVPYAAEPLYSGFILAAGSIVFPSSCSVTTTTTTSTTTIAPQVTYDYIFTGMDHTTYRAELWVNSESTYERVVGSASPFTVTYDVESKYDTVRGSGADLNLLSEESMQFVDLYTTDMQGCKVKLFNTSSGDTLIWTGYLSSELYTEPFNEKNNYTVSLTANDGLSLLERFDFYDNNGDDYEGFHSLWDIITEVFLKLDIEWNDIIVSISTTPYEFSLGANENIFEATYIQAENFYDEDGVPMNCREVIESILQPFGAYIQIINATLYITDLNNMASGTLNDYKSYDNTFTFVTSGTIDTDLGDVSDIKFAGSEQTMTIISPINKQKITFSTFELDKIIDGFQVYDGTQNIFEGTPVETDYGSSPLTWTEVAYQWSNNWTSAASDRFIELVGTEDNDGTSDAYMKHDNSWASPSVYAFNYSGKMLPITPYYASNIDPYYWLKFDMKTYIVTTLDLGGESTFVVNWAKVNVNLTIGGNSWNGESWVSGNPLTTFEVNFTDRIWEKENDRYGWNRTHDYWVGATMPREHSESDVRPPEDIYIPLWGYTGNDISIGITDYKIYDGSDNITGAEIELRIKDVVFSIVDRYKNIVGVDDIDYISYLDKNVKEDGEDIILNIGTNTNSVPTSRAGIMKYDGTTYDYTHYFRREGTTEILENLLARTIKSNYITKTIEIQCTINMIDDIFGSLTYSNYWTDYIFGLQGVVLNYSESTVDVRMQEIHIDGSFDFIKNYE